MRTWVVLDFETEMVEIPQKKKYDFTSNANCFFKSD